jgi:hypothetical protein
MTLLDATEVDRRKMRRRRFTQVGIAVVIIVLIGLYFYWPYYQARRTVQHFMNALVDHNYQLAYAIWQPDPKKYPMDSFMQDWGPSSAWGIIKSYKIDNVFTPPGGNSSGLVVDVQVNGIHQDARLWVQKKGHAMSFYLF